MATFDDIIASVLDAHNVGRRAYMPRLSRPVLPSSPKGFELDTVFPNETYDDGPTATQKLRHGGIPDNKHFRDPPIPPDDTNDINELRNTDAVREYQDNGRFRKGRRA